MAQDQGKTELRLIQEEELRMAKLFVSICKEHGLRYYMLGGTLLGAVRHKGFIPWDDDMDLAMPRSDYECFLEIAETALGEEFYLGDNSIDPAYYYPWARIQSRRLRVINRMAKLPRIEPVSIDIIPMDGFPDPGFARRRHKLALSFWWNLNQLAQYDKLVDQRRERSTKGKIAVKLAGAFKWVGKLVSFPRCFRHIHARLKKYPYDSDTKDVINFLAAYGFQETFPRESFGEGTAYEFEGESFTGPVDYDCVCSTIYGDYMTLPPEEERNKHHTELC